MDAAMLTDIQVSLSSLVLPAVFVLGAISLPAAVILKYASPVPFKESALLLIGLTFCGYIVGVMGGNSESPVMASIIPGLLGIMGGLVAYLYTKETQKTAGLRSLASLGLICLLLATLIGLVIGGVYKKRFAARKEALERYNVFYKEFAIPLCLAERKHQLEKGGETQDSVCPSVFQGVGATK